jgi:phenylalanyl-tRNA synthetase alpha chain
MNLKSLQNRVQKEIKKAEDLKELDQIFQRYLGKKGKISLLLKNLKKLPKGKRKEKGKELNLLKEFIEKEIEEKEKEIKEKLEVEILKKEKIDVTAPGKKISLGHLHPLTLVSRKVQDIFQSMGFSVVEGPEIENEWYNFDALNIPKDHPARDLWNTFWLRQNNRPYTLSSKQKGLKSKVYGLESKAKLLLRTHTSPVQVRYMERHQPPLRIIVPGRVFRHEATDASHEVNFYHIEGLMVDKNISVANFKAIIQKFYQKFFEREIGVRLIPCYFPFTEPSFEVDITCLACGGKGCSACQKTGWMEMMGAGMVHPNVFKNSGLNLREWQGFAFGMGLDRLAMMKYKINDIRLFYSGDLRFLQQF